MAPREEAAATHIAYLAASGGDRLDEPRIEVAVGGRSSGVGLVLPTVALEE